jgi:hypothetical protein
MSFTIEQETTQKPKLEKIGGALILLVILLNLILFRLAATALEFAKHASDDLTEQGKIIVIFNLISTIVLFVYLLISLAFFYMKYKISLKLVLFFYAALCIYNGINLYLTKSLASNLQFSLINSIYTNLIILLLLIVYFKISDRVRKTFLN